MQGTISVTKRPAITVHTYTAPEQGWLVTSHILEFASQLLVVDAQYALPYAREVAEYVSSLYKPMTRLVISHSHPDHHLGAEVFGAPIFALADVKAKLDKVGDRLAAEEHAKFGDMIPIKATTPQYILTPGPEVVDGARIEFSALTGTEMECALIVTLPDAGVIITQDLVYNRVHLFLGERNFDGWIAALRRYRLLPYDTVLPGHGIPGGVELYDDMIVYLEFAQQALANANDADDFKGMLMERFPDYGACVLLEHQGRFLFPVRDGA